MRTSCMWALWGTRMLPTISAVFFSRSTEERIGRGFRSGIGDRNSDLAICAASSQIVFAGAWDTHRPPWSTYAPIDGPGSGLYRSQDAGKTWTRLVGNGLPMAIGTRRRCGCSGRQARVCADFDSSANQDAAAGQDANPPQMQAAGHATEQPASIVPDSIVPTMAGTTGCWPMPILGLRARLVFQRRHHRSAELRCRLHAECRSVPLGRWREDNFDRARRAGRRRLSPDLGRSANSASMVLGTTREPRSASTAARPGAVGTTSRRRSFIT